MTKLTSLLAVVLAGALAAVVFFWRKREGSWSSMWDSAKGSGSSWSKTAGHRTGAAADTVAGAAQGSGDAMSSLADELREGAARTAHEAGGAVDSAESVADDATTVAASNLADEVKGDTEH